MSIFEEFGVLLIKNRPDYVTAQEYYQNLSQRVWVNFINSESKANSYRILEDGNKRYSDVFFLKKLSNN